MAFIIWCTARNLRSQFRALLRCGKCSRNIFSVFFASVFRCLHLLYLKGVIWISLVGLLVLVFFEKGIKVCQTKYFHFCQKKIEQHFRSSFFHQKPQKNYFSRLFLRNKHHKGPSINYVVSKSGFLTPSPPLSCLFTECFLTKY